MVRFIHEGHEFFNCPDDKYPCHRCEEYLVNGKLVECGSCIRILVDDSMDVCPRLTYKGSSKRFSASF